LAMFFTSHESSFRVLYDCYIIMAARRVLGLTPGHASHVRKRPRCNESPGDLAGCGSSPTSRLLPYPGSGRRSISMLMDHIPVVGPCSHCVVVIKSLVTRWPLSDIPFSIASLKRTPNTQKVAGSIPEESDLDI
jgi:hypothetical protein